MEWKAGDIAICINNSPKKNKDASLYPPLRLNYEYVVNKVKVCECGDVDLDVGIYNSDEKGVVCDCGARSSPRSQIWWCDSKRFKKKEYAVEVLKQIFENQGESI
jgi:hypothetical protein